MDAKILGWMLKGPAEINLVYRMINSNLLLESFMPQYKEIASEIYIHYSRYRMPPSINILNEKFSEDNDVMEIVYSLDEQACEKNEVGHNVDKIKKRYNNFLLQKLSESIVGDGDLEDRNKLTKRVLAKIDNLGKSDVFSEGNFTDNVRERADRYKFRKDNPEQAMGVLTGYRELDDYTWGIKHSELLVIAGASSSGKSLLMMNMGVNAWLGKNNPISDSKDDFESGKNVVFFTLEMNKQQLEDRMDSCIARIRHTNLSRGSMTEEEERRFSKSLKFQSRCNKPGKKFRIIDLPRGATVRDIEAKYEAVLGEFQPDLICVDYLGIMSSEDAQDSDWLGVGKVAESMHEFCRKQDIPIITAAQRKTKGKVLDDDEDANLENIGRSKMIGDNANIALIISNRKDEQIREDMEIVIDKNRDGRKGKIHLRKVFDQMRVEDYPNSWSEDAGEENAI